MKYENFNYRTFLILKSTFEGYMDFLKDLKAKNIVSDDEIEQNPLFLLITANFKDIAKLADKYLSAEKRINIKRCSKDEKSRNILKKEGEYQFSEEQSLAKMDDIDALLNEKITFSIDLSEDDINSTPRVQLPFDQKLSFKNLLNFLNDEQVEK